MKKLIYLLLPIIFFLSSCSDEDTACWEFYLADENSKICYENYLRESYVNTSIDEKLIEQMIEHDLAPITICNITESEAKKEIQKGKANLDKNDLPCDIIFLYRKVTE